MARQISIREEYLRHCDEATLDTVIQLLSKEFLLITLDDYCIEVAEQDYTAVCDALEALRHDIQLNDKHKT